METTLKCKECGGDIRYALDKDAKHIRIAEFDPSLPEYQDGQIYLECENGHNNIVTQKDLLK